MKSKKIIFFVLSMIILMCVNSAYAVNINENVGEPKDETYGGYEGDDYSGGVGLASSSIIEYGEFSYMLAAGKAYLVDYRGTAETLEVPERINGFQLIGLYSECFANGKNLKKVIIPDTIRSIYVDTFLNSKNLENIEVASGNDTYASYNGILYSKDYVYMVTCPEGRKGTVTIKDGAEYICDNSFFNACKVTSIVIPASVYDIGPMAFYGTTSLQNFNINSSNKTFTYADGILYDKAKTEVIDCVGSRVNCVNIASTVKTIRPYAFYGCSKLVGPLNLPNGLETIGEYAFYNCNSLDGEIILPDSLTTIEKCAFYGCNNINSLILSKGLKEIPDDCFQYMYKLNKLVIPSNVKKIGERAFFMCNGIETLTIEDGVETIGNNAFDYLESLRGDLVIPDSVTKIGTGAFMNSPLIDGYIVLGKNVTDFGQSVVYNSENAKGVIFRGIMPSHIDEYSFLAPNVPYYYLEGRQGLKSYLDGKYTSVYDEKPVVTAYINDNIITTVNLEKYGMKLPYLTEPDSNIYNFEGWYYDQNYTKPFSYNDEIMKNTNLYAKVEEKNKIEFNVSSIIVEIGKTLQLDFKYTLESGATVDDITWSSSNEDIISVDQRGNVTANSKGEATITASYKNTSAQIVVTGFKDENQLSFEKDEITVEVGQSSDIIYNYHLINGGSIENIKWTSSDESVATVQSGVITAIKEGTTTITATYDDVTDDILVHVVLPNRIDILENTITLKENKNRDLDIEYYFNDDATIDDISWSSTNENIAYVENGTLYAKNEGSVTITATYMNASDTFEVTVVKKDMFKFSSSSLLLVNNKDVYDFEYTMYSYDIDESQLSFTSSNEEVAKIEDGKIHIGKLGQAIITATYGDAIDTLIVNVVLPNRLNFVEDEITVEYRKDSTLDYTIDYAFEDGGEFEDIVFISDNRGVIDIENNAPKVVGAGEANLTIKYNELEDTIKIKVISIDKLSFNKSGYILKQGESIELDYVFDSYDKDESNIIFSSTDNNVARVVNGKIFALSNGETQIRARYKNIEARITVIVSNDEYMLGDVDFNHVVNSNDASLVLDIYNSGIMTDIQKLVADVNFDGVINSTDAAMILDMYNSGR